MKYFIATLACGGIFILYSVIGVALHWKNGGGLIDWIILFVALGATWKKITKSNKLKSHDPRPPIEGSNLFDDEGRIIP